MRMPMVLLCSVVGVATLLTSCGRPAGQASGPQVSNPAPSAPAQRLGRPEHGAVARPIDPDKRVGAIFLDGGVEHVCTGSVLHSSGGNLVITAAHCLAGAAQATFVPGLTGDAAPTDLWTTDAIYLDPRWIASKDPYADYAIARVSNRAGGLVESHTGSALTLGTAPAPGSPVTVVGYPSGVGGSPIGCQASTAVTDTGFPSLACEGLVGGTSGGPWVSGNAITGLTGGLEHGGCAENVSYSAPFDEHIAQLLDRAQAGGPGDSVPVDLDDPC